MSAAERDHGAVLFLEIALEHARATLDRPVRPARFVHVAARGEGVVARAVLAPAAGPAIPRIGDFSLADAERECVDQPQLAVGGNEPDLEFAFPGPAAAFDDE